MKRLMWIGLWMAVLLLASGRSALAQSGGGFDLSWWTIDGGGASFIEGGGFSLGCTIGQHDASDALTGGGFTLYAGFWFPAPSCTPNNGDADGSGCVNDADLLRVLSRFGLTGGNLEGADTNCDGTVNDADLLTVLSNYGRGC